MNDLSHEETLLPSGDRAPVPYDRCPTFADLISEKDVAVPMRDGVNLSVDIYRPDGSGKFPALLAFSIYNKDLQGPDVGKRTAATARVVFIVGGTTRSRRHAIFRVAWIRPRYRFAARHL